LPLLVLGGVFYLVQWMSLLSFWCSPLFVFLSFAIRARDSGGSLDGGVTGRWTRSVVTMKNARAGQGSAVSISWRFGNVHVIVAGGRERLRSWTTAGKFLAR